MTLLRIVVNCRQLLSDLCFRYIRYFFMFLLDRAWQLLCYPGPGWARVPVGREFDGRRGAMHCCEL